MVNISVQLKKIPPRWHEKCEKKFSASVLGKSPCEKKVNETEGLGGVTNNVITNRLENR